MPIVLIETAKQYSIEEEIALMAVVQSALQESFKISNNDIHVRLLVHAPHRYLVPAIRTNPTLYTHISIDCFIGRSLDTKRHLYRNIADKLEMLGIPSDHVKILLRETPKENWGLGSQAGCDVKLEYSVEV